MNIDEIRKGRKKDATHYVVNADYTVSYCWWDGFLKFWQMCDKDCFEKYNKSIDKTKIIPQEIKPL